METAARSGAAAPHRGVSRAARGRGGLPGWWGAAGGNPSRRGKPPAGPAAPCPGRVGDVGEAAGARHGPGGLLGCGNRRDAVVPPPPPRSANLGGAGAWWVCLLQLQRPWDAPGAEPGLGRRRGGTGQGPCGASAGSRRSPRGEGWPAGARRALGVGAAVTAVLFPGGRFSQEKVPGGPLPRRGAADAPRPRGNTPTLPKEGGGGGSPSPPPLVPSSVGLSPGWGGPWGSERPPPHTPRLAPSGPVWGEKAWVGSPREGGFPRAAPRGGGCG